MRLVAPDEPANHYDRRTRPSRSLSRSLSIEMRDGDLSPERSRRPKSRTPSSSKPDQQNPPPTPSPRPPAPRSRRKAGPKDPVPTNRSHRTRRPRIPSSRLSTMSNSYGPKTDNRTNQKPPAQKPTRPPEHQRPSNNSTPDPGRPRLIRSRFINVNRLVSYSS